MTGENDTDAHDGMHESPGEGSGKEPDEVTEPKIDLPRHVQSLFAKHRRLRNLFSGTAKGAGADGLPLKTPESFDLELTIELVLKGVRDASTLAAVLKARPAGQAGRQGDAYLADFIVRALDIACPRPDPTSAPKLPFNVGRVTRFNADPPSYTIEINGIDVEMTSAQLFKLPEFKQRYFDLLHEPPALPSGRGAQSMWEAMVPQITSKAENITPLADATRHGGLEIAIKRAIEELPRCDDIADLRHGVALEITYRRRDALAFTTDAIVKALAQHDSQPTREEIAQKLPKLGCAPHKLRVRGGKRGDLIEVWRIDAATVRQPASHANGEASSPSFDKPSEQVGNTVRQPASPSNGDAASPSFDNSSEQVGYEQDGADDDASEDPDEKDAIY